MASPPLRHFRWWPRRQWRIFAASSRREVGTAAIRRVFLDSTGTHEHVPRIKLSGRRTETLLERPVSFSRLVFESDVLDQDPKTQRLVDSPSSASNYDIWELLLDFRFRKDGFEGVKQIWRGMHDRGVDLPAHGALAHKFWNTFCSVFLLDPILLEELVKHACTVRRTSGRDFVFLYGRIMPHLLRHRPEVALHFFHLLCGLKAIPDRCASIVLQHALKSADQSKAFECFKEIYVTGKERHLYDLCHASLKSRDVSFRTMYRWHKFLISHADMPTQPLTFSKEIKPFARRETSTGSPASSLSSEPDSEVSVLSDALAVNKNVVLSRERFSSIVGEVHGVKRKQVTDAFCARVFATLGISTSFMITGLAMLGLDIVGPLALRELAARSGSVAEFRRTLAILKERNIAIMDCTFSKTLRRLADHDRQDLFDSISSGDLHPDVYDDPDTLERLAQIYLREGRGIDAHALLDVLSYRGVHTKPGGWKELLQVEARSKRPERLKRVMQDMLAQGETIDHDTFIVIQKNILRPRRKGKEPHKGLSWLEMDESDSQYVGELLLSALRQDQSVPSLCWRELLTRHGMARRMGPLERLSVELVQTYLNKPVPQCPKFPATTSPTNSGASRSPKPITISYGHTLRRIFTPLMQRAIIAWGVQSRAFPWGEGQIQPGDSSQQILQGSKGWLSGLALLARLRDLGMPIDLAQVRKELIGRLGMLYTPGVSIVAANRALKERNDVRLSARFDEVQQLWGGKGLFPSPPMSDAAQVDLDARDAELFRWLFVRTRWLNKSRTRVGLKMHHLPRQFVTMKVRRGPILLSYERRNRVQDHD